MKITFFILAVILGSCGSKHKPDKTKLNDYDIIELLKANDQPLPTPKRGDWLYKYNEPGQTFEQYKLLNPVRPSKDQQAIYLQPIGIFSEEQKQIIQFTSDYLKIFFCLKAIVLKPISDSIIPKYARRTRNGSEQLLATYINNSILTKIKPKDAIVIMAITAKDLYPENSWNYIFGLASYEKRIGVSSIFRYSDHPLNALNYQKCLERLIQTSSHEIGHMFSLLHCINAYCVMNGSNSLSESDSQPNRLCSECLHKLYWNIQFDNEERLKDLKDYFKKHKLGRAYALVEKDIQLIEGKKDL